MNIKVERKDTTEIKLTIAKNEVRLKIPPRFSDEEVGKIVARAEKFVQLKGPQDKTLRLTLEDTPLKGI